MKKTEFSNEAGGAKMLGYKTNKIEWLDQVEDEWDKSLWS